MIRIAFVDWWEGFDKNNNFITDALKQIIEYEIVDVEKVNEENIDFLFCSIMSKDFLNFDCPRIVFTGENYIPDFNLYDYGIGFEYLHLDDRYIRYPLYIAYYKDACNKMLKKKNQTSDAFNRDFCSMVVSNGVDADIYRDILFERLSNYKRVSSGGKFKNNIGVPTGVKNKEEFLKKYKFNIACENVSHKGYCTEKIVEAFAAGTIPIYWGDTSVEKHFNPKAFINCNSFETIEDVIDYIKQIDTDEEAYMNMLNQPAVLDVERQFTALNKEFEMWLAHVVKQKKKDAYRRNLSGWSSINERYNQEINRVYKEYLDNQKANYKKECILIRILRKVRCLL